MNQPQILFQGELGVHPVPRLLNHLYDQEQTGRLALAQEGISKAVFLVQGIPAYVESTLRDETLGRYLVKQGKISEEDFEKSLELMMSENLQQGAALVKLGKLKPKELYQVMKSQTLHKISTAFSFQEGQYRFYSETEFLSRITRFEFAFHHLLKDGVYHYFPEESLDRELNLLGTRPLDGLENYRQRLELFKLTDPELEFSKAIDGSKTLADLINLEPAYPFARKLIYLFALCGLIGPEGKTVSRIRELAPGEEEVLVRTEGIVISAEAPEAVEMEETEEEKESPDQIGEFYLQMKGMNYFGLLGVEQSAQDPEVEQAYRDRMNGFERANFSARMDPELEMKLEEINTEIIKAYESLRNQERREQYLAKLRPPEKSGAPSRGLEAEKYLQEGIKSVRARDWGNAQKMFEKAVELRPDEPEYFGYLGWSIYSNPEFKLESRREMAKGKIRQAIKMNPNMDSVHVFLGKILKDEGKKDQAIQEFREALRCNANCREAKRELEAQGLKG